GEEPTCQAWREYQEVTKRAIDREGVKERDEIAVKHLRDPSRTIRILASRMLLTARDDASTQALRDSAKAETDPVVLGEIVGAMFFDGTPEATAIFLGALEHAEAYVRVRAV